MSEKHFIPKLGGIAARNPRKVLLTLSVVLTLLLLAIEPAAADGTGGGYNGP